MPISYSIDRERRRLDVLVEGEVTAADFATYFAMRDADPAYAPDLDMLADARAMTAALPVAAMRYFGTETRLKPRVRSRRAIVADRDAVFGLAKVFQAHAEGAGPEYQVFRDLESARAWLGERLPGASVYPSPEIEAVTA